MEVLTIRTASHPGILNGTPFGSWVPGIEPAGIFIIQTRNLGEALLKHLHDLLDKSEAERARRFRFLRDRDSYVAVHGMLRLILGRLLQTHPSAVRLKYTSKGKPMPADTGTGIFFSLSHSRDISAICVNSTGETGIDVEFMDPAFDYLSVSEYCFLPAENAYIARGKPGSASRFYELWTRKEALLKAIGTGISSNLDVEVYRNTSKVGAALFPLDDGFPEIIHLDSFPVDKEYMLSVATPQGTGEMSTLIIADPLSVQNLN